ncbi:ABC transporter substrate-binding protein [Aeromicrobium ginsengisoli]|uniref:ABC transporter substrate-binding protein n=1 Tax=Aeromicrobium ginsengisoli TaxID=363867 RepID=UPI001CB703BD|nr:ABC transporter substrate-binding protein [Aeromicrobium ginsengisoli]
MSETHSRNARARIRKAGRRGAIVALVAACIVSLAACGDDSEGSSSAGTPKSLNKATGTPIKLGILNPVNGSAKSPGAPQGLNAAVKYVNGNLGGIDNHPIKVVSCDVDVASPETNIGCANQLAKSGVVAVIDAFNPTSSAALPILQSAKIPMIGPVPFDTVTGSKPDDRVYFGPAPAAFLLGAMQSIKQQGYSSVTLANLDLPSGHQTNDQILTPLGKSIGLDVKGVYYSPSNPNFSVLASTIKSTKAEVAGLLLALDEPTCNKLAQSLQNVGFKGVIFLATCTEFINKLGQKAVGAETYSSVWLPTAKSSAPAEVKKNLDVAADYLTAQGGPSDWYAFATFATVVDFAKTLGAAKPSEYTGPSVLKTLKAVEGYQSFLGPVLSCNRPTSPNCTTEFYNFKVVGNKKTELVGGKAIQPDPKGLKAIPGAN